MGLAGLSGFLVGSGASIGASLSGAAAIEFVLMVLTSAVLGKAFVGWGSKDSQRVGFWLGIGVLLLCLTFCWSVIFGSVLGLRSLVLIL
ncbi:hypothetical protein WDW86_02230 [Bdellovibrionota bacterium FG-2]